LIMIFFFPIDASYSKRSVSGEVLKIVLELVLVVEHGRVEAEVGTILSALHRVVAVLIKATDVVHREREDGGLDSKLEVLGVYIRAVAAQERLDVTEAGLDRRKVGRVRGAREETMAIGTEDLGRLAVGEVSSQIVAHDIHAVAGGGEELLGEHVSEDIGRSVVCVDTVGEYTVDGVDDQLDVDALAGLGGLL